MRRFFALICFLLAQPLHAATNVEIPAWRCSGDVIGQGGFEDRDNGVKNPSLGAGFAYPNTSFNSIVTPTGFTNYHLIVPEAYRPGKAAPLLFALHGTAPPDGSYAQSLALSWTDIAEAGGFVLVVPNATATGQVGGQQYITWALNGANSDEVKLSSIVAEVSANLNIDRSRIYGWGFSAGAHALHRWALANTSLATAYTAQAGALNATSSAALPAAALRKLPVLLRHASDDNVVPYSNATVDRTRFLTANWIEGQNFLLSTFTGGHTYDTPDLQLSWDFMCRWAVQ